MGDAEKRLIAKARAVAADAIIEDMKRAGWADGLPEHMIKDAADTLSVALPALMEAGLLRDPDESTTTDEG